MHAIKLFSPAYEVDKLQQEVNNWIAEASRTQGIEIHHIEHIAINTGFGNHAVSVLVHYSK